MSRLCHKTGLTETRLLPLQGTDTVACAPNAMATGLRRCRGSPSLLPQEAGWKPSRCGQVVQPLKANHFLCGLKGVHLVGGACGMCSCLSVEENGKADRQGFLFFLLHTVVVGCVSVSEDRACLNTDLAFRWLVTKEKCPPLKFCISLRNPFPFLVGVLCSYSCCLKSTVGI